MRPWRNVVNNLKRSHLELLSLVLLPKLQLDLNRNKDKFTPSLAGNVKKIPKFPVLFLRNYH